MSNAQFFDSPRENSRIKTLIVSKYLDAWANVMLAKTRGPIQYLDLFAGPGQYDDGTPSTPLVVLKKAVETPKMRERLVAIFNDADKKHVASLEQAINGLPGAQTLKHKPAVYCSEVDDDIVEMLAGANMVPTFFFADPWGYKGISLKLLRAAIKDFGSDCVLFFNYNRVNAAINNPMVEMRMQDLFGEERTERVRQGCNGLSPSERELYVVEEFCNVLRDTIFSANTTTGKSYVLPFRFRDDNGARTSHHR